MPRASDDANTRPPGRYHSFTATRKVKTIDEANRKAWFVASSIAVDCYGDIVLPSAFIKRLDRFRRHSPFLAGHQSYVEAGTPTQIGTVDEIALTKTEFRIGVTYATTATAEEWWTLARNPTQTVAVSVGFIPHGREQGTAASMRERFPEIAPSVATAGLKDTDRLTVYTDVELLEVSQCSIPANPEAVQLSADAAPIGEVRLRKLYALAGDVASDYRLLCGASAHFATKRLIPVRLHRESHGRLVGPEEWRDFAAQCAAECDRLQLNMDALAWDMGDGSDFESFQDAVYAWVNDAYYEAVNGDEWFASLGDGIFLDDSWDDDDDDGDDVLREHLRGAGRHDRAMARREAPEADDGELVTALRGMLDRL